MSEKPEVMAKVCWQFTANGIEIKGSALVRTHSGALKICETMIRTFGEGTHWVEPQNVTFEEVNKYLVGQLVRTA